MGNDAMPDGSLVERLTRREREVLGLLAEGFSAPEIAEKLTVALSSVKSHVQHVYGKLGVNSKREALTRATELGLFAPARPAFGSEPAQAATAQPVSQDNLPAQVTSFVGQADEVTELKRLLTPLRGRAAGPSRAASPVLDESRQGGEAVVKARLVTVTGSAGTGKTRLALQVARELRQHFGNGVWLIELAALADPALISQTIAAVFGLKEEGTRSIAETLTDHLRGKQLLLILDNCEHLVQSCAQIASSLLLACPDLTILATSREALGVPGERCLTVPTLSVPAPQAAIPVESLRNYGSVNLFVERAVDVSPRFALTNENAQAVARVCRRLDGIPLAIELAAARLRMLPVEQIAADLDDSFRLLTGGSRTALPRQQTLQASIDWSYELLTAPEQTLLRRLAVFAGGWTLEAAEAAGAGAGVQTGEVFDLLARLIDKSLVQVDDRNGLRRYRLLETIRQYALAKLAAGGEVDNVRQRQAAFYLALITASEAAHRTSLPLRSGGLAGLELEQDNLRAALAWCQSAAGGAELGVRLASALDWFWFSRGHWSEAQTWLEGALAHPQASAYPRALAQALESLGTNFVLRGDYDSGQVQFGRSLRLFQELKDRPMAAFLLNRLGWVARERGDAATARLRLEESLALYRELGDELGIAWSALTLGDVADTESEAVRATALLEESLSLFEERRVLLGIAWAHNHLGHLAQLQGDYARAARLHKESLPEFRQLGESLGVAWAHQGLGETALAQGDSALATAHFAEGVDRFRDLGDRAGLAWCLAGAAGAAAAGQPAHAAWLWGAAESLRQSIGARDAPTSRATRERLMAQAREQMGAAAFDEKWTEGRSASPEQAIARTLESQ